MRVGEFKLRQAEKSGLHNLGLVQKKQVKKLLDSGEFSNKAIGKVFGLTYNDLKTIRKSL